MNWSIFIYYFFNFILIIFLINTFKSSDTKSLSIISEKLFAISSHNSFINELLFCLFINWQNVLKTLHKTVYTVSFSTSSSFNGILSIISFNNYN